MADSQVNTCRPGRRITFTSEWWERHAGDAGLPAPGAAAGVDVTTSGKP